MNPVCFITRSTALWVLAALYPVIALSGSLSEVSITGPTEVLPGSGPEYIVTWEGGTAPWTVQFDATDPGFDFSQEQFINKSSCNDSVCASFPFFANYSTPQISEVTATVIDGLGEAVHANPQRVRVGSDGLYHIVTQPTVDVRSDPNDPGRFLCFGGEDDPPYMDIIEQDRFPVLDVYGDDVLPAPSNLTVSAQSEVDFMFAMVFGIADRDWVKTRPFPPPDTEIALDFPLRYGNYSDPDTLPWEDPLIPSPPVAELTSYSVRVPTPPDCNDPILTRTMEFFANPAQPGDVALSSDPAFCAAPLRRGENQDSCTLIDGAPMVGLLTRLSENRRLAMRRRVFISCVTRSLIEAAIMELEFDRTSFENLAVEEAVARILTDGRSIDKVKQFCLEKLDSEDESPRAPEEPTVDMVVESGPMRVTVTDPEVILQLTTEFASITTTGLVTYSVAQLAGNDTIVKAGDKPITVVPTNTALSPQVVPPMFEVTVNHSAISQPQLSNLIFRANFD